ncbi:MAG: GerW family sporulation protein [Clostridiales bacterium]|nr:GerW family sporulation protein [Clostridiales bacterium]
MSHPIEDLMSTTMQKIREMVDANTIVGTPISTADGITLIPISKLSFGFGSGGSDIKGKTSNDQQLFGGGGGAGVLLCPVAFIVISNGSARILSIAPPPNTTADRVIDLVPEVMDRIKNYMNERKEEKL